MADAVLPPGSVPPSLFGDGKKREGMALYALGLMLAAGIHVGAGVTTMRLKVAEKPKTITMAMVKKAPPPPPPPPEQPKEPEPPKPKELPKKVAKSPVKPPDPTPAPPPPNATPPKDPPKKPVPILSGLTLESTTNAPSSFNVAVGNTLYDDPNKNKEKPGNVQKYSAPAYKEAPAPQTTGGSGDGRNRGPFKPAPKFSISTEPEVAREAKPPYPPQARAAGIEGVVELRVEIWQDGTVRSVKVVRGLGYGLDEAAVDAMKRYVFKPATMDGVAVQYVIPRFLFRFELQS